jgi:hypothetical protein
MPVKNKGYQATLLVHAQYAETLTHHLSLILRTIQNLTCGARPLNTRSAKCATYIDFMHDFATLSYGKRTRLMCGVAVIQAIWNVQKLRRNLPHFVQPLNGMSATHFRRFVREKSLVTNGGRN